MTRARILADYVSSGDELALKAPLASPTFTGTVAIPNVANLETAVVANTAKTSGSTNASDLASGTLATARMAAGTVIQVVQGTPSTTGYTSTSFTDVTCTDWTATINKSISGSSIFASWNTSYSTYQGNNSNGAYAYIHFNRTAPTSVTDINKQVAYARRENGDTYHNVFSGHSGSFVDTSSATGNHTYVAHIIGGSVSSSIPEGVINTKESTLVLMEVIT
jgi:hypothetical protein